MLYRKTPDGFEPMSTDEESAARSDPRCLIGHASTPEGGRDYVLPPAEASAIRAEWATPRPRSPQPLPYTVFRDRLTDDERKRLHAARKGSWDIDDFIGLAQAQNHVDLADCEAIKAALVKAAVLDKDRIAEVFAPFKKPERTA